MKEILKKLVKAGHLDLAQEVLAATDNSEKIKARAMELQLDRYYEYHLTEAIKIISKEFEMTDELVRKPVEEVYYDRIKNETREYGELKDGKPYEKDYKSE